MIPFKFATPVNRPFLFTSFVSSIDGKIIVKEKGYWPIGTDKDKEYFTYLRAHADAVVDARNTALRFGKYFIRRIHEEMYQGFRKELGKPALPEYIVLTSHADEELASKLTNDHGYKPTILTTTEAVTQVASEAFNVVHCHPEVQPKDPLVSMDSSSSTQNDKITKHVQVSDLITYLNSKGYKNVFIDGGPNLIAQLLQAQVLDEIHLTIAPKIFGSLPDKTLTMVEGILFAPDEVPQFKLESVEKLEDEVVLRYRIS